MLPRKKRRTYGFQRAADGTFRRVLVQAADEFAGSYEDFLGKATAAAKRGMELGGQDFERLNPGGAAFLRERGVRPTVRVPAA